jgi:hypothetical protein
MMLTQQVKNTRNFILYKYWRILGRNELVGFLHIKYTDLQ